MADANIGLLAEAVMCLLNPSYLPLAKDRCERARKRYFNYQEGTKQKDIKQEYIVDGNNVKGRRQRRRSFRGWRLPRLGWDDEVEKINDWIEECLKYRALNVATKEEAYDIIRTHFVQYKQHKSETFYEGYPPIRETEVYNGSNQNDQASQRSDEEQNAVLPELNTEDRLPETVDSVLEDPVAQSARELFETTPVDEDIAYSSHVRRIIGAARNDRLFFFLCKISEDVAERKMDCVAAAILDVCKTDDLKCDILVTDALHYASARQKGAPDLAGFHLQKHCVRTNAALLKIARASIPGARPYEDMAWLDFPMKIPRSGHEQSDNTSPSSGTNRSNLIRAPTSQ